MLELQIFLIVKAAIELCHFIMWTEKHCFCPDLQKVSSPPCVVGVILNVHTKIKKSSLVNRGSYVEKKPANLQNIQLDFVFIKDLVITDFRFKAVKPLTTLYPPFSDRL